MDKQVYDLTRQDLLDYPIWYFPMDESVEDELTVRPITNESILESDYQVIIRTRFIANDEAEYVGYLYWGMPENIEYLKPVMFAGDGCITFWNGMIQPSFNDYTDILPNLNDLFPIKYSSEHFYNYSSLSGKLNGLYYLDDNDEVIALPHNDIQR